MAESNGQWRLDMGAAVVHDGVRFRVWAPTAQQVDVEILTGAASQHFSMASVGDGLWEAIVHRISPGTRYRYRLNGGASFPDPCSRSQPQGVHGPSEVIDPDSYQWHDQGWRGLDIRGLVIYECHVGTFTPAGTFESMIPELDRLVRLGVNAIELMPVAAFSGRRNWGYDGVYPYAPTANYGGPNGLKRLVDAAHQHGLGVIMDVVYNHLGPEGNYLSRFSPYYFTDRYHTPWGDAINYDGPNSHWVRKYVIDNACYWVNEYHIDGLRLDATFKIYDNSEPHVLEELTQAVRSTVAGDRQVVLIAETSENNVRYLLPYEQGGFAFDAIWADDFHHSLRRYLLGDHEGYYEDYEGTLSEVAQTINQGFLYEGAYSRFLGTQRGTPAREQPAWQFQYCIQTHDQIGNRAMGDRLHHSLDLNRYRVASALLLLLPYTPLLFMGQEFAASSPFLYFTDHNPDLGRLVTEGRRNEFKHYSAFSNPEAARLIPDPQAEKTFLRSKLDLSEATRSPGAEVHRLYEELLRLRRNDAVLSAQNRHAMRARAVTDDLLVVHSWLGDEHRLLLANFGAEGWVSLAAVSDGKVHSARLLIDTDDEQFGGHGSYTAIESGQVRIPARSAVLLASP